MKTTDDWLKEKLSAYNKEPKQTLEDMLLTTTDVIEQYLKSPSRSTRGLIESCLQHNKLFIENVASLELTD